MHQRLFGGYSRPARGLKVTKSCLMCLVDQSEAAEGSARPTPSERGGASGEGQGAGYHGGSEGKLAIRAAPIPGSPSAAFSPPHETFRHGHEEEDHPGAAEPEPGGGERHFFLSDSCF